MMAPHHVLRVPGRIQTLDCQDCDDLEGFAPCYNHPTGIKRSFNRKQCIEIINGTRVSTQS